MSGKRNTPWRRTVAAYDVLRGRPPEVDYGLLILLPMAASVGGAMIGFGMDAALNRLTAARRATPTPTPTGSPVPSRSRAQGGGRYDELQEMGHPREGRPAARVPRTQDPGVLNDTEIGQQKAGIPGN